MVYNNRFVLCVVVDGKVQTEKKNGVVVVPFGSEYHLRLRNKNNRRAVVKIFIDGDNVSGNGYVIPANDFIEIERHNDKDRAFKFVDLDSPEAVDAGKNGDNDDKEKGTIEARFYLEKERKVYHEFIPSYPIIRKGPFTHPWKKDPYEPFWHGTDGTHHYNPSYTTGKGSSMLRSCNSGMDMVSLSSCAAPKAAEPTKELSDGCTVEGNATGQTFRATHVDLEDDYVTCRIFLQGYVSDEPVHTHPVITDAKYCENCGSKSRSKKAKFCSNCGEKF